jgi:P-type Mg2+ transporter
MESAASASLVALFIRSRKPFFKSKPGKYLLMATLIVFVITLFLPFSPLAGLLEFQPLSILFLLVLGAILIGYIVSTELLKGAIYARVKLLRMLHETLESDGYRLPKWRERSRQIRLDGSNYISS